MSQKPNPIPPGYHTLTPSLVIRDCARAIEFYKRAFHAEEVIRMLDPSGRAIMHAELRIGDSLIMMSDEMPQWGALSPLAYDGTGSSLWVYVEDVDATYRLAVAAGAKSMNPPEDMFWGDRMAKITDPFGHVWSLATHVKDMTPEEMRQAGEAFFADLQAKTK